MATQGSGCSTMCGGQGTSTFDYFVSPFADGYNTWKIKTVETLPDGVQNIAFTNYAGQVILSAMKDTANTTWATYYRYDASGRCTLVARPSAVLGYDESRPDLLYNQSGNYLYLLDGAGLIEETQYGTTTTATDSTPGDVLGYVKSTSLRRGELGTPVPQSTLQYYAHSPTSGTASLGDKVWLDTDRDGIQDAGEYGQSGVTVNLLNTSGTTLATTTTGAGGAYQFANLAAGSYIVQFTTSWGYGLTLKDQGGNDALDSDADPSTGRTGTLTLTEGQSRTDVDAGLVTTSGGGSSGGGSSGGGTAPSGDWVYPVARATVYRNTDGTGARTTSYDYTWFPGTTQQKSVTVTKPIVTAAQNGPGAADVETTVNDAQGRPIWHKDGDGFLTYTAYDARTGAAVKTIVDVDTTRTSDFTDLPSSWSTRTGGGLHLVILREADSQGRTTKLTDPAGNVTYTVYLDANHEVRTYPGWNSATGRPTGPTQVWREDRPGSYTETLTMSDVPAVDGSGRPTGAESISDVQSLSRTFTNAGGQVIAQDAYFDLSGVTYLTTATLGTEGVNYYRTSYSYNRRGWQSRLASPTGTITRFVYDALGRATSTWVGLDDTPTSGGWSPTNTDGTDLVRVSENVYDDGTVGDSNLTQSTQYPGGTAAARVSKYFYDWRDRLVATKSGVQTTESTEVHRPITYTELDNLGQPTARESYDGDGITVTDANNDGVPDKPSASLRRARMETLYDEQGRAYRTKVYSVDSATGTASTYALATDTWYGHRGQVLKTAQPGGPVQKHQYDGAGRVTKTFSTDGSGDSNWSDAAHVTGDVVLTQTETQYDAAGNAILTITKDRFHDETATGELGNVATSPHARVSYVASYYDKANRLTDTVNVGTNGGAAYTRPSTVPARSDTALVASQAFDPAGLAAIFTDPRGIETRYWYDALGRTTRTIEAYTDGVVSNADDKTTEYTYDAAGHPLTLKAQLTGGAYQKTQFLYAARTSSGSDLNSNDILSATRYPDPTTGDPSASEQETYTTNALGERKTLADRNGSVHTYAYDVLGRTLSDAVTTLATGVDGAVRRIDTAYDTQGNPYKITSYDAASGGSIVNQVQRSYNGLAQLTAEYQSHSGAVNTSTTPKVQYTYSEMSGGVNHSRQTGLVYPNGRLVSYNYSTGLNDRISRLSSLSDSSATLETYAYLGLATVVERGRPQPGVNLTYITTNSSTGDAGDPYVGLDRFGRVVDQNWYNPSTATSTDRFVYGYDRDGNRLYRDNLVNPAFGELYQANGPGNGYDALNQLTAFARGPLNAAKDAITSPTRTQAWTFDALGNWTSVTTDGVSQTRSVNAQNEVSSINGQCPLGYDANGNMTADETGSTLLYDAWNRLTAYKDGASTQAAYQYDGLARRTVEESAAAINLYYSSAWQVLEERIASETKTQYVWSAVYVDAIIQRGRDIDGDGTLELWLLVQQDANWNVAALVDSAGTVVERYMYDPYGSFAALTESWETRSSSAYNWMYLHQGGRLEKDSGLYHFRFRNDSLTLGRWASQDPLGYTAGDPNLYRGFGNSPITHRDPGGLFEYWAPGGENFCFTNEFEAKYNSNWGAGKISGPNGALKNADPSRWCCRDLLEWIGFTISSMQYRINENNASTPDNNHSVRIVFEADLLAKVVEAAKNRCKKNEYKSPAYPDIVLKWYKQQGLQAPGLMAPSPPPAPTPPTSGSSQSSRIAVEAAAGIAVGMYGIYAAWQAAKHAKGIPAGGIFFPPIPKFLLPIDPKQEWQEHMRDPLRNPPPGYI